jgi:hypothetical protein
MGLSTRVSLILLVFQLTILHSECSNKRKRNIKEAYDDFKALSHTDGVFQNIDWNSAAALEYLGPAAFNKKIAEANPGCFCECCNCLSWIVLQPVQMVHTSPLRRSL